VRTAGFGTGAPTTPGVTGCTLHHRVQELAFVRDPAPGGTLRTR
jgi:hypothetical protein